MSYISSTYTSLYFHIVFSTKHRSRALHKEVMEHLKAYTIGYINNTGAKSIIINGIEDHIHLLFQVNNTHFNISEFVRELKKSTNKMLNQTFFNGKFAWQEGYFVGTISRWDTDKIKKYIQHQEEHHKTMSFEEEWDAILNSIDNNK